MNGKDSPSNWDPRWLTACGVAILLMAAAAVAAFPPDPGRNDWQRLERVATAAQIVSLLAVGFVFAQLRLMTDEQRKLADRLSRNPDIHIGFAIGDNQPNLELLDQFNLTTYWVESESLSQASSIVITTWNQGSDSAREVQWTYRFPDDVEMGELTNWGATPVKDFQNLVVNDRRSWVHPDVRVLHTFRLRFPRPQSSASTHEIQFVVPVVMADAPVISRVLRLNILSDLEDLSSPLT